MADLIIKNFQYPRNDDGTFVKPDFGLESVFVVTIFADDKTGKITVRPWSAGRYGLKEEYEATETNDARTMKSLVVKNFQYPREEDGRFIKEHYGFISSFVVAIFADDKTGKITVKPWSSGRCGLKEEYEAVEIEEE